MEKGPVRNWKIVFLISILMEEMGPLMLSLDYTLDTHIWLLLLVEGRGSRATCMYSLWWVVYYRICVGFLFWFDWSKGAVYYHSDIEDIVQRCRFGLHLWLFERDKHFWNIIHLCNILDTFFFFYQSLSLFAPPLFTPPLKCTTVLNRFLMLQPVIVLCNINLRFAWVQFPPWNEHVLFIQ